MKIKKVIKKGTRVIYQNDKAKVVLVGNGSYHRFKIKIFDRYTVQGINVLTWVSGSDLELDTQYYRDIKLKRMLDE